MTNVFCAKLTCLLALAAAAAGLAQNQAFAQATLDAARPQFGSGLTSYPAAQPPQPVQPAQTIQYAQPAQPVAPSAGWQAQQPAVAAANVALSGNADPDKKFGAGDTVSFSIAEDRDPPVLMRVTDTGELGFPYI